MRIARRLLAAAMCALAALAMCVGLAGTAWGEDGNGSITINNAVKGQTYTAYQIFDLSSNGIYIENGAAYAYYVHEGWSDFVQENSTAKQYLTATAGTDGNTYVEWTGKKDASDLQAFANAALKYAQDRNITGVPATSGNDTTAEFSDLPLGYYVISSSVGAVCVLDTTTPDVTINDKNSAPKVVKEVQENSTSAWGATNDAAYGDTVNFRITVSATNVLAQGYTLTDTMGAGLKLPENPEITVAYGDKTLEEGDAKDYVLTVNEDKQGFTIKFNASPDDIVSNDKTDATYTDTTFVITYTATVTNSANLTTKFTERDKITFDAANADKANLNTASINWGTDNKEASSQTWTNVHQMSVFKFTGEGDNKKPLANAEFELRTAANGSALSFIDNKDGSYSISKANTGTKTTTTLVSPTTTGRITLKGLDGSAYANDDGVYYLVETKAPAGYNALKAAVEVKVAADGTVTYKLPGSERFVDATKSNDVYQIEVQNNTGTELPSTGGMGTTVIYVAGGLLVAAAVVLLVAKKKMSANDK